MGQSTNVFILADELKQHKKGHKVEFTAYLDGQGRLQGKDLKSSPMGDQSNSSDFVMPNAMSWLLPGNSAPKSKDTSEGKFSKFLETFNKTGPKSKDTSGGELGEFSGTVTKTGPKF